MGYQFSYFAFDTKLSHFIFGSWHSNTAGGLVGPCVFCLCLALVTEALRCLKARLTVLSRDNPLAAAQSQPDASERSPLLSSMLIPPSIEHLRRRRIKLHAIQALLHMVNGVLGYTIMLAIMTYNAWVALSSLTGYTLGYFIFSAVTSSQATPGPRPQNSLSVTS